MTRLEFDANEILNLFLKIKEIRFHGIETATKLTHVAQNYGTTQYVKKLNAWFSCV